MNGYVYILRSLRNGRFYIGSTDNIERRLLEHNLGKSTYTSESGPWEMVFNQEFDELKIAKQIEYKLKKFKNKNILEMIISRGRLIFIEGKITW